MKLTNLFGKVLLVWVLLSCNAGFAQISTPQAAGPQNGLNEKVVKAYYTAFEKKDWNSLQQILADGFTFSSPVDDHISVKAFKERCWPNAYKIKRIDVDKVVINGDDAVVITNGWTTDGKLFRNSDYFKLKDGKISAYECFFGPGINYPNNSAK
jgi:ketosteroid isomerase-like protein